MVAFLLLEAVGCMWLVLVDVQHAQYCVKPDIVHSNDNITQVLHFSDTFVHTHKCKCNSSDHVWDLPNISHSCNSSL